jgi:hypothetical protein
MKFIRIETLVDSDKTITGFNLIFRKDTTKAGYEKSGIPVYYRSTKNVEIYLSRKQARILTAKLLEEMNYG